MTEKRNSRIALLAIVMLLSGAFLGLVVSDNASAAKYDINGFVSDLNSDVSVIVLNRDTGYTKSTTTLADGFYAFNNLNSGVYDIRYSKDGFLSIRDNLTVSADGTLDTVTMVAAPSWEYWVRGTVTAGGVPVSGATVSIISLDTNEDSWWGQNDVGYTWTNTTNETGFYRISDLPYPDGGLFGMRVESADHYTVNLPVVNTNPAIDFTLENITSDNNQNINVKNPSGDIIDDATVFMYEEANSTWTDAVKFGGATYILSPNTGNTVFVYAYHEDYEPAVVKLSDISESSSFEMIVGENNLADDDVIYIPSTPAFGSQSDFPMIHDRIMKLNIGPTAKITSNSDDYVVTEGGEINFSASGSSSVVGIASYDWGGDNTAVDFSSTFAFSGNPNVVTLSVTDNFGFTDTVTVNVTADADNPIASFTSIVKASVDDNGTEANETNVFEDINTVVFNASESSDVTSSVSSYSWDFGDDNTDTGKIVSHIFDNPGTFEVVLTVADGAGNTANTSSSVIVQDITSPSANFNWSYVDSEGTTIEMAAVEGKEISFNAGNSNDNSGEELTYEWDFSDGTNKQGKEVTHTFVNVSSEGFDVLLVVTDGANNSNQRTQKVSVAELPRADLFVSELLFSSATPMEDDSVVLTAVVKLSNMNVTGVVQVGFYLNNMENQIAMATIDGSELVKGSDGVNLTSSWKAVSGTHTIFAVVDPDGLVDEGVSEAAVKNNEFAKNIEVTAKEDSNDTSIILLALVVLISVGAVGYIYKDSIFGK